MTATIAEQIRHLADTMATQPPNGAIRALAPVRANLAAAEMLEGVTDFGLIRPGPGLLRPPTVRNDLARSAGRPGTAAGLLLGRLVQLRHNRTPQVPGRARH